MLEAVVSTICCVLAGLCGVHRRVGFRETFPVALVATPVLVLPVLFFIGPSPRAEWRA